MTTPAQCPFCFPAEDRIAFEDRLTRGLWDAFPVSEGHLLIVPRRHVPTWFDTTAEERAALTAGIDRGRELIASRHRPDGYFLYPNVGKGDRIELHGEAVYCLRRFRDLIGDMAETAWVRFVRRLPRNHALLGDEADLREFLFGSDRTALGTVRDLLREVDGNRCFYCADAMRGEPVVDHFVPWSRYPLDLGHNFVLADARCNGGKLDRLAAFEHLERWCARNARPGWTAALDARTLPHDARRTSRVARWAYAQAEHGGATVWQRGRDVLVNLDLRWRELLLP